MKFTDGNWLTREGFELITPVQLFKATYDETTLKALVAPQDLTNRGAQLDLPLLTVEYSSPIADVIRVKIVHHKGVKPRSPEFPIHDQRNHINVTENDDELSLSSGNLTVKMKKTGGWGAEYLYDGELITGSGYKGMAHITDSTKKTYMREELGISVGENLYGLGERFTPFIKNGQVVDTWNKDGGTSTEQSYKNIPFYLSNKGYGIFVNHPENVSFEIGSEKVSKVQFSVEGESLEYFIIGGGEPKKVLENYTALTGKPALPPAWSFGLWLTTSFTTNYDEQTVNQFVQGMAERELPLHVFHFDCFWMEALKWCDFEWDKEVFPDPKGMLQRLKEKGLKICVWINPYIAQQSDLFDEAVEKGYLLKKENGDVWQWDKWQPGMGIVDFTNPEACEWYNSHLKRLLDMGVDSFKTDFGERIPTDVVYYDNSDPVKMHNYYSYLYNKVVFELLEEQLGVGEAALFARSSTAGGQQFPIHWGGDCDATYESMAESLRGGLSLGLSGFGYWSHDIGGFESTAPADLYKRWAAFGLLSSHSRLHGSKSYRVPWIYDEESVDVIRFFTKLKCSLMPYLYNEAFRSSKLGIPMMRAMLLEYPSDPSCDYLDRQYMLGESLLVAPVFSENGVVSYYLPNGSWTNYLTNEVIEGGKWIKEHHDYMSLPLFARPNSIIAVGDTDTKPDYDYAEQVELHVFQITSSATSIIRNQNGEEEFTVMIEKSETALKVRFNQVPTKPWSMILRGMDSVSSAEGLFIERTTFGVKLSPGKKVQEFTIQL
ncbi:alpha-glucosidase [Alkalihalobacillus alcalophilus ATCC 27647 = CGMCC 1.3604]|uniref:alpha-D-xyloside xylohydrolase n=1 Tax=Alkalihalobacillus alcalophilus ATCC 27647 = CGMCC 1.3604 TaxID=1218173 RepID=A0A4S4JVI1_ALKAL|nr:alpha-xylosidase [Alkalihalobacillus alcalophilus]MED1561993.1 alpha-xylosidase [Alkalihalobacillus alcalophilus]THG89141.1 alpha-glucosidase [Alkalihalobacillus alcalophilus ATCC 27647 = CGMCC 1.3604]